MHIKQNLTESLNRFWALNNQLILGKLHVNLISNLHRNFSPVFKWFIIKLNYWRAYKDTENITTNVICVLEYILK